MSRFEIKKRIFACHVSKNLLSQLERYIKDEIPKQISIPKKVIDEDYSLSIRDKSGEEKIRSISSYSFSRFPDSTNKIIFEVFIVVPKYFKILIDIDREYSGKYDSIEISYESNNARETVLGIYEGIKRIIELHRNHNELFHPGLGIETFISAIKYFILILAFTIFQINQILALIFFLMFLVLITYSFIGNVFKQYITYETNYYLKLQKSFYWFLTILLSLALLVIGLFITGFWNKLLVWIK